MRSWARVWKFRNAPPGASARSRRILFSVSQTWKRQASSENHIGHIRTADGHARYHGPVKRIIRASKLALLLAWCPQFVLRYADWNGLQSNFWSFYKQQIFQLGHYFESGAELNVYNEISIANRVFFWTFSMWTACRCQHKNKYLWIFTPCKCRC